MGKESIIVDDVSFQWIIIETFPSKLVLDLREHLITHCITSASWIQILLATKHVESWGDSELTLKMWFESELYL